MKIIISNRSGIPIYEQIKEQIKEAIFAGVLSENEQLPSIRKLARSLKISVITTTRAYNDLEAEGFIASVQGKGSYVLPQNKAMIKENARVKIENSLSEAIVVAEAAGILQQEVKEMLLLLYKEKNNG